MSPIEIQIESECKIYKQTWSFHYFDNECKLVLNIYRSSIRATTRHKYRTQEYYNRLDKRNSNIKIEEVPFGDSITNTAKKILVDQITVHKQL